jgi:hypothetical protein
VLIQVYCYSVGANRVKAVIITCRLWSLKSADVAHEVNMFTVKKYCVREFGSFAVHAFFEAKVKIKIRVKLSLYLNNSTRP